MWDQVDLWRGWKSDTSMRLNPSKDPGHQGSGELPWLAMLHACSHTSLLGKIIVVPMTHWERITRGSSLVSPGP